MTITRAGTSNERWADDRGDVWDLTYEWAEIDGRLEVVGFRVSGTRRVTADLLREVRIGERVKRQRRERIASVRSIATSSGFVGVNEPTAADEAAHERVVSRAAAQLGRVSHRRTRHTVDDLEQVAQVYREAFDSGPDPVRAVAEHFHLSLGGARHRIAAARNHPEVSLGPAPGRGRAGG